MTSTEAYFQSFDLNHRHQISEDSRRIVPLSDCDGEEKFPCPTCEQLLSNKRELTMHIRSHNVPVAAISMCAICGKVLSSQSSLDRHMLVHSGERPFQCTVCDMSFTTNGNMHRHMNIHKKDLNSSAEEQSFLKNGVIYKPRPKKKKMIAIELDLRRETEKGRSRKLTKRKLRSSDDDLNEKSTSKKRMIFDREAATVNDKSSKRRRVSNSNLKNRVNVQRKVRSKYNGQFGLVKDSILVNIDFCATRKLCPFCSDLFLTAYGLLNHTPCRDTFKMKKYVFRCSGCSVVLRCLPDVKRHIQTVHSGRIYTSVFQSKEKHNCREERRSHHEGKKMSATAGDVFSSICKLTLLPFSSRKFPLVSQDHRVDNCSVWSTETDDHKMCDKCQRLFPCQRSLDAHSVVHLSGVSTECARCDILFESIEELEAHLWKKHDADFVLSSYCDASSENDNTDLSRIAKEEFLLVNGLKVVQRTTSLSVDSEHEIISANNVIMVTNISLNCPSKQDDSRSILSSDNLSIPSLYYNHELPTYVNGGDALSNNNSGLSSDLIKPEPELLSSSSVNLSVFPEVTSRVIILDSQRKTDDELSSQTNVESSSQIIKSLIQSGRTSSLNLLTDTMIKTELMDDQRSSICGNSNSTFIQSQINKNMPAKEISYQCLMCEGLFTTRANCERHIRRTHKVQDNADVTKNVCSKRHSSSVLSTSLDESANGQLQTTKVLCKYCQGEFDNARLLSNHSRSSCQCKPYVCKVCSKGFATKTNCVKHIRLTHKKIDGDLKNNIQVNITTTSMTYNRNEKRKRSEEETSPSVHSLETSQDDEQPLDLSINMSRSDMQISDCCHNSPSIIRHGVPINDNYDKKEEDEQKPIDLSKKSFIVYHSASKDQPSRFVPMRFFRSGMVTPPSKHILLEEFMHNSSSSGSQLNGRLFTSGDFSSASERYPLFLATAGSSVRGYFSCTACSMKFDSQVKLSLHLSSHTSELREEKKNDDNNCASRTKDAGLCVDEVMHCMKTGKKESEDSCSFLDEANNNIRQLLNANLIHKSALETLDSEKTAKLNDRMYSDDLEDRLFIDESQNEKLIDRLITGTVGLTETVLPPVGKILIPVPVEEVTNNLMQSNRVKSKNRRNRSAERRSKNEMSMMKEKEKKKKRNSYTDSPHKLKCPFCPRIFPWKSSLNRHMLTHTGQKPFRCPVCVIRFSTKSNRERHLIRKHEVDVHDPTTRQLMDRPYKCHRCVSSSFAYRENLLSHYTTRHPNVQIPDHYFRDKSKSSGNEFDISFKSDSDPNISRIEQNREWQDDDEDDEVDDGTDQGLASTKHDSTILHDLSEMIVPTVPSDTSVVPPEGLSTLSSSSNALSQKQNIEVNPEHDNYNVDKITECWICAEAFDSRKSLVRHLKEHRVDLAFKCFLCDASFQVRRDSLEHLISKHAIIWDLLCTKNKIHDISDYIEIMENLVQETLLDRASIVSYEGMEIDVRPEKDYAKRKIYCSLCPKRFWSAQDLRRHMRCHTGDKPFECNICGARFTLKHSMTRHRYKHANVAKGITKGERSNALTLTERSNLLQNLLGIDDCSTLDEMLDSPDRAATMLGINQTTSEETNEASSVESIPSN